MFTKNFDILMTCATVGNKAPTANQENYFLANNTISATFAQNPTYYSLIYPRTTNTGSDYYGNYSGVFAGSIILGEDQDLGDIPAENYFDYYITHPIYLTAIQARMTRSITEENGVFYLNLSQTFTNNTGSTKKIIELGVYVDAYYQSTSYSQRFLMYRTVLPQAIEVESGANFQANLKIELPNFLPNKPSA